jgi:predicted MFS family arabinose efflux permease
VSHERAAAIARARAVLHIVDECEGAFEGSWPRWVVPLLTANAAMFLAMSGMFAMFFFNTLYIQRVLGYGPLEAGLAFLPFTAGVMLSASIASQFAPRLGVRPIAVGGFLLSAAGLVLLTQLPVDGSYLANVLPAILLSAIGMGAVFMPFTLIATTGLEDRDQGLASGLFNTSQQIGGALGLAVLSTLATSKASAACGSPTHALVVGFHWAFAGGALFTLAALAVVVALLRKRHVARIEEQAASGEPLALAA